MSSWRPLARRALNTLRPPAVAMRARKPMCLARLLLLGLYVGNIILHAHATHRAAVQTPYTNLKWVTKPQGYYSFSEPCWQVKLPARGREFMTQLTKFCYSTGVNHCKSVDSSCISWPAFLLGLYNTQCVCEVNTSASARPTG